MNFSLPNSLEILERTPEVLSHLLRGLSDEWTTANEGENTWSAYDVVGHLIHGEQTDWLVRAELILSDRVDKRFEPFDRFAQFEASRGKSLNQLLDEFKTVRAANVAKLRGLALSDQDLTKTGLHPTFGEVTLKQLLATWVVHDLDHLAQIARVMARQYKDQVGPWVEFLKIVRP